MIHELLQAISKKDYVSAMGLLEAAFKEKMADALEERRFEIIDEMFNSGPKASSANKLGEDVTIEDFTLEELQDFMVSEEFEQLDELSKTTLASYVKKATGSLKGAARHAFDAGRHMAMNNDAESDKSFNKARKRVSGVEKAVDKMVKEDADEIVEGVSSSSKQNYEYANGHKPKGNGRWMFSTIEPRKHDVRNDEHMKHTFTSDFASFSDASKAAVKHFKSKGHVGDIHVLS